MINKIISRLEKVKETATGYVACCPAHKDKTPSLSISMKDGKILLNCFAGCSVENILQAINCNWDDLFTEERQEESFSRTAASQKTPYLKEAYLQDLMSIADNVYIYTDKDYNPKHSNVRFPGKNFRQYRYDEEKQKWVLGLNNGKTFLYNLPGVITAIRDEDVIFIAEGEKDVESLQKLGLIATTSGGCKSWKKEYNRIFPKSSKVVIIPDNDDEGRKYARQIAEQLKAQGVVVKVLYLPDLQEKQDVTDWINAGGTKEKLITLVDNTCIYGEEERQSKIQELKNLAMDFFSIRDKKSSLEDNPIVPGVFYRNNISVLFGEPGIGKTWLILDLICNLVDGKTVFGKYETKPQKVLLLEGDMSSDGLKYRFDRLIPPNNYHNFKVYTSTDLIEQNQEYTLNSTAGQDTVTHILEGQKPDLLIIDSLGSWIEGDESDQKSIRPVINFLKEMANKFNMHVLYIHHPRKRGQKERTARKLDQSDLIGSSLISRYASCVFAVNGLYSEEDGFRETNRGVVQNIKNWTKEIPSFEYRFEETEEELIEFQYDYENFFTPASALQRGIKFILNALKASIEGITRKDIIAHLPEISTATIDRALRKLIKTRQVDTHGYTTNRVFKLYDYQRLQPKENQSFFQKTAEGIKNLFNPMPKEIISEVDIKLEFDMLATEWNTLKQAIITADDTEKNLLRCRQVEVEKQLKLCLMKAQ